MDAMERRCQIIEILCDAKMRIKMRDLASRFNVSSAPSAPTWMYSHLHTPFRPQGDDTMAVSVS